MVVVMDGDDAVGAGCRACCAVSVLSVAFIDGDCCCCSCGSACWRLVGSSGCCW